MHNSNLFLSLISHLFHLKSVCCRVVKLAKSLLFFYLGRVAWWMPQSGSSTGKSTVLIREAQHVPGKEYSIRRAGGTVQCRLFLCPSSLFLYLSLSICSSILSTIRAKSMLSGEQMVLYLTDFSAFFFLSVRLSVCLFVCLMVCLPMLRQGV